MIYRRDNNQGKRKKLFVILAIFFFLYLFTLTPIASFTRALAARLAPSIWGVGEQLALSNSPMISAFYSKSSLLTENEALKKEIRDISLKLLDRNLLYEENLSLKERLGRSGSMQTVVARVIAKPPHSLYDTLVIDVGSREGIKGGEKVLYGDNIMVGEIAEVFEKTSKVRLFSSSGENINVTIGNHAVQATAIGVGGGNFEIKIPRDTPISLGDTILVPSIMPHFLGVVEYIESKESDPFERILFKNPISPLGIETVEILTE
ncbi:MAG: rod shape-determining protein MreC [Candidatus Yonathbacteria bacterium]|nr:rod shape-determining protein MreC [Candidatus Yonathbacteria bacterium]